METHISKTGQGINRTRNQPDLVLGAIFSNALTDSQQSSLAACSGVMHSTSCMLTKFSAVLESLPAASPKVRAKPERIVTSTPSRFVYPRLLLGLFSEAGPEPAPLPVPT